MSYRTLVEKHVPDAAIDDALNFLLNCFLSSSIVYGSVYYDEDEVVELSKLLLDRGGSLCFKSRNRKISSIVALVELAKSYKSSITLSKLRPYMCCPLLYRSEINDVSIDPYQVIPLSCLAAKTITRPVESSEFPRTLRQFAGPIESCNLFSGETEVHDTGCASNLNYEFDPCL